MKKNSEKPREYWTEEELENMANKAAGKVGELLCQMDRLGFALGQVAIENHQEVLNGAKRVPDNEDTYKRLSKKLKGSRGKPISDKRLRALGKAYELRESLGGADDAPALSPDHYIEAVREGLSLDEKRQVLETAVEKNLTAPGVRNFVKAKLHELGTGPDRDDSYWHGRFETSISRSQSILFESYLDLRDHDVEVSSESSDRLNHFAILVYRMANLDFAPEGEG